MDEVSESFSKDTRIWQLKAERDALASMLKDLQKNCTDLEQEIDRLRKSYADILKRQTDQFLNEKKKIDRLRAILRWVVDTDPTVFRTADNHMDCKCHRCAMDAARTELGRDFGEKE